MNVSDFTYLLQQPNKVNSPVHTKQLEEVLEEYPYFQAARALHLKGLKNLNSFKYNNALKITAAYTTDREVLFDFITSKDFLQNNIANTILGKEIPLLETETIAEEVTPSENIATIQETSGDEPLPKDIKDAEQILNPALFTSKDPKVEEEIKEINKAKQELEIGKPLSFTKKEKYSFSEWLQLTSVTPDATAEKAIEKQLKPLPSKKQALKKKKFDLIDKFIESNPKIIPQEKGVPKVNIKESVKIDHSELMTETLAKVYLEQKKYKKAIQAYKILSLKYPEKSSFFADRIKSVEKIQKEN